MIFNKFSDVKNHGMVAFVKRDFWSDLRNDAYSSIGISQPTLDAGQKVIDAGKSILPPGGNIPINSTGIIPESQPFTMPKGFSITPMMAIGILGVVGLAFYFRKAI